MQDIFFIQDLKQTLKDICSDEHIVNNLNEGKEGCNKEDIVAFTSLKSLVIKNLDTFILKVEDNIIDYKEIKKFINVCVYLIQTRYYKNVIFYMNNNALNNPTFNKIKNLMKFSGCSERFIIEVI